MRADRLELRCYAEQKATDLWVSVCVDLCLAVQGESLKEVKSKLDEQIDSYLDDAMAGDDREYVEDLVPRKAPLRLLLKYHLIRLHVFMRSYAQDFLKIVPLKPRAV